MRKFNQNNIQKTIFGSMSIILIFFYGLSYGQSPSTIWLHSIPSKTGFSQSFNYHVLKDSEGFIWISSDAGLNRFDGQRVKLYESNNRDSSSLFEGMIYGEIFENDQKNLWFSTPNAIHQYHRKEDSFSHYFLKSNPKDSIQREYYSFAFEENRFLWLKTKEGIYQYDTDTHIDKFIAKPLYFYVRKGKNDDDIFNIFTFGGGELGLQIIETQNGILKKDSVYFKDMEIFDVLYFNDKTTWLSTKEKGLIKWNPISNEKTYFEFFKGKRCSITQLNKENLIVGVENQGVFLYRIDSGKFQKISTNFLLGTKSKGFRKVHVDANQNIWISDFVNGIYFGNFIKNKFESIPKFKSKLDYSQYSFRTMQEDQEGNIWCASANAGLFKFDPNQNKVDNYILDIENKNSLPANFVWDILYDDKNRIWALTHDGVALYQEGNNFLILKHKSSSNFFSKIIQLKKSKEILVASIEGEIFKIDESNGSPQLTSLFKSNEKGDCHWFFQDDDNNILVFFDSGLFIYKYLNGNFSLIKKFPFQGYVTSVWNDSYNEKLWIGTSNGLMKITKNEKDEFILKQSNLDLPSKSIKSLSSRNPIFLWIGTSNGLAKLNLQSEEIQTYTLADGVQSMEFHDNASFIRKNGEIWFGGFEGITIVPTHKVDSILTIPQLKITNIRINDLPAKDLICEDSKNTNVSEIKHISRPFEDNTISLEFVAMEYSDPSSNQLEYQLEKVDKKPVKLEKGDYGFARYPNLSPGSYTFKLRGANSEGIWSEQLDVLKITIQPPFYQTWWFYLFSTISLLGLGYVGYRYRINQIKEKALLNTRIAENKMAALRAQMNPHFIYNSMQTVNGIISRKDNLGAVKYINKFSRLMRMILENSRKGKISLEKEIELLSAYMEIEKRRFNNPFTYSITVDEEIDTFETEIPSMLTQPFVENAIKHGLFHRKEQGHIDLKFIRENGSFKCIIEDNGIGRTKSKELNNQTGRSHQSRGLEIVDDRLAIIRQSHPGNYKVKISDLFDLEHQPSGTRVEITLPFES